MKKSKKYSSLRNLPIAMLLGFSLTFISSTISARDKNVDKAISDLVSTIQTPIIPNRTINLCQFSGHTADETGSYDFQDDIRRAIDSLSVKGGGTLLFTHTRGVDTWVKQTEIYRIKGPIILKSNIELKFQPNVKLSLEFAPVSYLPNGKPVLTRYEGTSVYTYCPLIYAFNCSNIAITVTGGNGAMPVLDGNGEKWQKWADQGDWRLISKGLLPTFKMLRNEGMFNAKDTPIAERICADTSVNFLRPPLMQFIHCQKIKVEGVKLVNSPFWVVHPVFTTDFTLRNVMYDCQVVNNDGVDIESSSRVLIENVTFDNHDDNVVIKSGRDREGREGALVAGTEYEKINSPFVKNGRITAPTSDVVVRNCAFKGHYAFCVGSEIAGGAHNLYVTDCTSPMEVMMGVFLKSNRKRGGEVKDIYVQNLNFQNIKFDAICIIPNYDNDTASPYPTHFRNISISNIKVETAGIGIRIFGWEDAPIRNVRLQNINIEKVANTNPDKLLLINQVENVQLKNVKINNVKYNGKFNKLEKNVFPPKQN